MSLKVRFFARLREDLNLSELEIDWQEQDNPSRVWLRATQEQPLADNVIVAINHQTASMTSSISDGDEVAFFPPVTGG